MQRNRLVSFALVCCAIAIGWTARRYGSLLPGFVADYLPDTMWGLMAYFGMGLVWPRLEVRRTLAAALAFSYAIEFSQLYHAPWIDGIRAYRLGHLVLGSTFVWSDLACYTVGVGFGAWLEARFRAPRP